MIAGITLWLCIGSTYRWDNNPAHNRANFYGPAELARKLHHLPNPGGTNREEQVKLLYERLSPIFDQRLEQYKANLQAEDGYIWYMLLFTAAAASLLAVRGSSIKVPILEDVIVPLLWVYAVVPACLGYLWIRFGFTLNELIDARIVLWKLSSAIEAPVEMFNDRADFAKALYTYSMKPAIYDGGYMDGWFLSFREDETLKGARVSHAAFFMMLWGIFLGVAQGAMLGLVYQATKRFKLDQVQRRLFFLYFWLLVLILFVTHVGFWYAGQHANWLQPVIIGVACLTLGVFAVVPVLPPLKEEQGKPETANEMEDC
jgi:hypothetical protein